MILALIEHDRGRLNPLSLEMLAFGRNLAQQAGLPLEALLIGAEAEPQAAYLAQHGVAKVHLALHERLNDYAPEAWGQTVAGLVEALSPQAVIAPGSDRGHEVLAHAAALAGLPLAANCIEAQPGEPYVVTRQRWGGTLLEEARLHGRVKLLTVAAHAWQAAEGPTGQDAQVSAFTPALTETAFRVRLQGRVEATPGKVSLAEAPVVVGGGRGVGSAEGFQALEALAQLLNGTVGCSRAVTSLGWRPHADQIGQTGTRIAPELYIACGVSGASQHMVGCKSAKHILAINKDPEAPIVAQADYAIIGDLHEVVPALVAAVRAARGA
jgi:electron transfer flavoprotein alpha subunit